MGHRGRALKGAAAALLALALPAASEELTETIVVSAARGPQPAAEAPGAVTVVPGEEIAQAKALDEALRRDPSFAVFRRSSSLVADPTSQGVNLRGIGPSGVSRALVLEDGVPLNDGFGGWVYWGAVPRLGIQQVEAGLRWTSAQFEDDGNQLRLPGFAVFDLQVSRAIVPGWDVFVAAENLLDRRYLVGLQGGVATLGQPLFLRAGVRARLF